VNIEMNALTAAEAEVLVPFLTPENEKVRGAGRGGEGAGGCEVCVWGGGGGGGRASPECTRAHQL
jgi:hypothetical protein